VNIELQDVLSPERRRKRHLQTSMAPLWTWLVILAKAGIQLFVVFKKNWIPAFARMTSSRRRRLRDAPPDKCKSR
jgi:hypothetical protein